MLKLFLGLLCLSLLHLHSFYTYSIAKVTYIVNDLFPKQKLLKILSSFNVTLIINYYSFSR